MAFYAPFGDAGQADVWAAPPITTAGSGTAAGASSPIMLQDTVQNVPDGGGAPGGTTPLPLWLDPHAAPGVMFQPPATSPILPGAGVPDALAAPKSKGLFGLGMIGTVAVLGLGYFFLLRKKR